MCSNMKKEVLCLFLKLNYHFQKLERIFTIEISYSCWCKKMIIERMYYTMALLLVVVISSSDTANPDMISLSIASNSSIDREFVTINVISKLATMPVKDGIALGTSEVGEIMGLVVGLAVTKAAQTNSCVKNIYTKRN